MINHKKCTFLAKDNFFTELWGGVFLADDHNFGTKSLVSASFIISRVDAVKFQNMHIIPRPYIVVMVQAAAAAVHRESERTGRIHIQLVKLYSIVNVISPNAAAAAILRVITHYGIILDQS